MDWYYFVVFFLFAFWVGYMLSFAMQRGGSVPIALLIGLFGSFLGWYGQMDLVILTALNVFVGPSIITIACILIVVGFIEMASVMTWNFQKAGVLVR